MRRACLAHQSTCASMQAGAAACASMLPAGLAARAASGLQRAVAACTTGSQLWAAQASTRALCVEPEAPDAAGAAAASEVMPPGAAPQQPPAQSTQQLWHQVLSQTLPAATALGSAATRGPATRSGLTAPYANRPAADVALGKLARPQELMYQIGRAPTLPALLYLYRQHGSRFDALHVSAAIARTASLLQRSPDPQDKLMIRWVGKRGVEGGEACSNCRAPLCYGEHWHVPAPPHDVPPMLVAKKA